MKLKILAIASTATILLLLFVSLRPAPSQPIDQISKQQKRAMRAEARQERYARETRRIDSLIQSRDWQFIPMTISQFAGPTQAIFRNYFIDIWNNDARIYIPYYKGYVNQYLTILNFDIPIASNYSAEKVQDGWHITFSGQDFYGNTYTFVFDISTPSGSVSLEVRSAFYNTVSYTGSIG